MPPGAPRTLLRPVYESDLPTFFAQGADPEACRMAAFVHKDPSDRAAFEAHWQKLRSDPTVIVRTIEANGEVVGHLAKWELEGEPQLTYWIGRAFWGQGLATAAVLAFLAEYPVRPLYSGAAADNLGSLRVLEKCGFCVVGSGMGYANGRGAEIEERFLRLD